MTDEPVTESVVAPSPEPQHETRDGMSAASAGASDDATSSQTAPPPPVARQRLGALRSSRLRSIVLPFVAIVAVIALIIGGNAYLNGIWYVSTENAQVTGTPVPVGSLNAGRVEAITVDVGSPVHKGDVLARVLLPTQVSSASVREGVFAPFDGTVIAIPVGVGATVSPGQGIVTIVDPGALFVNANIDESAVRRVSIGQRVEVHLDALNSDVEGTVEGITPASAGTFSLLPQENSSGTFTKVAQLVPVKIGVDVGTQPLLVGTSAEVKIHVTGR